jgi:hypothetical protein
MGTSFLSWVRNLDIKVQEEVEPTGKWTKQGRYVWSTTRFFWKSETFGLADNWFSETRAGENDVVLAELST